MMIHPTEKNVQAVAFYYDRIHWKILDPSIAQDIDLLRSVEEGDMTVVSRSLDDKVWIVVFTRDNGPARYYLYDHEQETGHLSSSQTEKSWQGLPLAKMIPAVIKSRDGLDLVCYYTCLCEAMRMATGCRKSLCRWFCTCTAAPGPATTGGLIPFISGWPTGATPS